MEQRNTCPSAIINNTWYCPPLCSTIDMPISITGANDVGPVVKERCFELAETTTKLQVLKGELQSKNLQAVDEEQFPCTDSTLPQTHYNIYHLLDKN